MQQLSLEREKKRLPMSCYFPTVITLEKELQISFFVRFSFSIFASATKKNVGTTGMNVLEKFNFVENTLIRQRYSSNIWTCFQNHRILKDFSKMCVSVDLQSGFFCCLVKCIHHHYVIKVQ